MRTFCVVEVHVFRNSFLADLTLALFFAKERELFDFLCMEKSLVIEIDGGIHDDKKGYHILRCTNEHVLTKRRGAGGEVG
ncbi:MAG: DUF559 domain-containing protein [bacterium]|nr:DUF559 domain-containing protein [bacterium]